MSEGGILRAYSDHGCMRHSRPPTPAGVALYGSTVRCPDCNDPGAMDGHKGKVEVCLCAVCGHGYPEPKQSRVTVVRIAAGGKQASGGGAHQKSRLESRRKNGGAGATDGFDAEDHSQAERRSRRGSEPRLKRGRS